MKDYYRRNLTNNDNHNVTGTSWIMKKGTIIILMIMMILSCSTTHNAVHGFHNTIVTSKPSNHHNVVVYSRRRRRRITKKRGFSSSLSSLSLLLGDGQQFQKSKVIALSALSSPEFDEEATTTTEESRPSTPLQAQYFSEFEDTEDDLFMLSNMNNRGSEGGFRNNYVSTDWKTNLQFLIFPIAIPIMAFTSYEEIAKQFSKTLDLLFTNTWVSVDGGMYQSKIIAPALNGVAMPSMSILFATLISTTITSLLNRQNNVRIAITDEANEIRHLQLMLDSFPTKYRNNCRIYLIQYTTRVITECQPPLTNDIKQLEITSCGVDSELNGILKQFNLMSTENVNDTLISSVMLDKSYNILEKLNIGRSKRLTAMLSTFPTLHYFILATLAASILTVFLIETSQELMVFLNSRELRIVWTMICGTFSCLGLVLYDLRVPFTGSYKITGCVEQLYIVRLALKASLSDEES